MGWSSDDGGGETRTEIRYASYIEDVHEDFLNDVHTFREALTGDSPFTGYTDIEVDDVFFGASYAMTSFPSLYDMFGKFMAGLDIDDLFSQIFETTVNSAEINNLVAAEGEYLNDDVIDNVLPQFELGARDINAVLSDSFVMGKAVIWDGRDQALAKFSAELKYRMIPVAVDHWKMHLGWNGQVVMNYAEIMKFYFSAKMDVDGFNRNTDAKDKLWPFTVMEYERAALGALSGAKTSTSTTKTDDGGGWLSDVLGGASALLSFL